MKRLLITSTDLMMVQFLVPHVKFLAENGYNIDLACSEVGDRFNEVMVQLSKYVSNIYKVRLRRSPLSTENLNGYKDLKEIIERGSYDVIWTNEPVMGVMTRLAAKKARKAGSKVIYMAHGFHFYNGAPLLNWCLFYPIEKMMSSITDMIVCVNHEDYVRAESFKSGRIKYIHGIGINTERLNIKNGEKTSIREELNLHDEDFLILSVGELNKNKNQSTAIKALAHIQNPKIHYLVCGKGDKKSELENLAENSGLTSQVHFLGYRKDVVNICSQSDLYIMPSFREGLPVSSLEAMYCGLPLVTSNIRGLVDVNKENINGFLCDPDDYLKFAENIKRLYENAGLRKNMGEQNRKDVMPFTIANTLSEVKDIIDSL